MINCIKDVRRKRTVYTCMMYGHEWSFSLISAVVVSYLLVVSRYSLMGSLKAHIQFKVVDSLYFQIVIALFRRNQGEEDSSP